jgi:hypothetical protein
LLEQAMQIHREAGNAREEKLPQAGDLRQPEWHPAARVDLRQADP